LSGVFDSTKSEAELAQAWGAAINSLLGAINNQTLNVTVTYDANEGISTQAE
jgi:hypothetical protein